MTDYRTIILVLACCQAATMVSSSPDPAVPRRMRQLYKQYRRGDASTDGNTVRYIPAYRGSETSQSKLLFDLSSVHKQNETLVKAELHFYRRSVEEMSTIQIDSFEISSYYISLVERRRLSAGSKGWQLVNITSSVKRCTNTIKSNNKLGIGFSNVNKDSVAVPVNMPQFLRHHDLPFILLYTNNTRTLETDQITARTRLTGAAMHDELNAMINPETGKNAFGKSGSAAYVSRERRDVADNKVDNMIDTLDMQLNVEDTYNELTNNIEVQEHDSNNLHTKETTAAPQTTVKPVLATEGPVQYIPWPKLKGKHKRPKTKNRNKQLLPTFLRKESRDSTKLENYACGRKPLRINFEDIGWGQRIIEPKKMDAYYCAGACSFPYSYGNQLTNHATLQSLITSIHQKSKVPQPCCVPEKLESVTLLYYDEYANIVLKTYSDMSVESCVCR